MSDVATVRFGIITGANDFFYISEETAKQWGIEEKFLETVMTSPQESRSILVDPAKLPYRLFVCTEDENALKDTGALEYIRWGESHGYHRYTACEARKLWYNLGAQRQSSLAITYMIHTTARTFFVNEGAHFPNTFHRIYSDNDSREVCLAANSTLFQLILNVGGRSNLGGGALKIERYEVDAFLLPDPALLSALADSDLAFLGSTDWDVLNPSEARRTIDDAVFDALELTQGERDAVYEGVTELVENRLKRAKSV